MSTQEKQTTREDRMVSGIDDADEPGDIDVNDEEEDTDTGNEDEGEANMTRKT